MVRIGASLASSYPPVDESRAARLMVERTRAAADAGLEHLTVGDQHAMATPYVQGTAILGRLLAEWDERPAGCLFLVPLWNPVLMAELIGTLATIAAGPFIVQTGIGHGDRQFAAMGADIGKRPSTTEETIRVVKALLAGDEAESELLGMGPARTSPRPPREVEWWIGAGGPAGLRRAARIGDAWYCGPGPTTDQLAGMLATYLEACSELGREPARVVLRRDVLVTDDAADARRIGDELVAAGYRGMTAASLVNGGVDDVAERFAALGRIGFTDIVVRQMAVPQDLALRSYELLGEVRSRLAA